MPESAGAIKKSDKPAKRASLLTFKGGTLSDMVRRGIQDGRITPVFQPLLDLRTREVSGFEMLARWYDPVHGQIPPDEFIPIADAEGLLTPLTEQMLHQACAAATAWPGHLTLAVNISPLQLEDRTLPERIRTIAAKHGFPLQRLEIEITEQALLGPLEVVRATVLELKALGMAIVMDDFGIGHASLSRLHQLPFDKIKIDRSFVDALGNGAEGAKIIAAIIGLGLSLGVTTVAEGVEDQEQADMLARLGCAVSQGWLYGRPVPADEVPQLLRTAGKLITGPVNGLARRLDAATETPTPVSPEARLLQLESIFDAAPVGLGLLDLDFRYITVNPVFARMYGLSPSDFSGRTVPEVLPGPAAQILAHLERSLTAGSAVECEITLDGGRAGLERTYLRTAQPVRDAAGSVTSLSVALADITERKRVEVALREREEDLRHTVELNPHIPWTCGPSGRDIKMSNRWYTLTGSSPEETEHRRLIHPDELQEAIDLWQQAMRTGEPIDCSFRVACEGGAWRWIRSRAFPRRDARGAILRWYGTIEDIHERKLVEAALLSKTRRLEEATRQLTLHAREDHLTGLANRRHLDDLLQREVGRTRRSAKGAPLSLVMIDVDRFKIFNDTYGHPAGDECLRRIAASLRGIVRRKSDLAARYGGEEFVIVLPHTSEEGALKIARQACEAVRGLAIAHHGATGGVVTISAGIASLELSRNDESGPAAVMASRSDQTLATDLIQTADFALYAAKTKGRNCAIGALSLAGSAGKDMVDQPTHH